MTLMKVSKFLERVNYALRGTDDDVPTPSDDDGKYWIETYNRKKDEMYGEVTKNWASAFEVKEVGEITVDNNLSFELTGDDLGNFIAEADQAYVIDTNGQYHYFDFVKVNEVDRRYQNLYVAGANPQKLYFTRPVTADDAIVGGTLYLPGYWMPEDLDAEAEGIEDAIIVVDDPEWAVMAVAAQIAFNDITYEEKFDDLDGQAGVLWKIMVKKNRRRNRGNPETSAYKVKRIRGVR
jgi:hypothetical protein